MEALRIRIPQRYQSGIAKLIALQEHSLDELFSSLDEMPLTFNLDRLKSQIAMRISNIFIDDLEEIIDTLEALHFLYFETDLSLENFIEQLCQAMDKSGNEKLKLNADMKESFNKRLFKLMNGKMIAISTKARNILHQHPHSFGRVRVTTDVSSVFGPNTTDPPVAAIIVHILKLHYIQDQQHKDFFMALDTADIAAMIDTLKQAQEKAEALKSTLTSAHIPYIDAE